MDVASQDYRQQLTDILVKHYEDIEVVDPMHIMLDRFEKDQVNLFALFADLNDRPFLEKKTLPKPVLGVIDTFYDLMEAVRQSNVVIAYLPKHDLSMGTAMEMWHARALGKYVITITEMKHNLAILSSSDLICSSIEHFAELRLGF